MHPKIIVRIMGRKNKVQQTWSMMKVGVLVCYPPYSIRPLRYTPEEAIYEWSGSFNLNALRRFYIIHPSTAQDIKRKGFTAAECLLITGYSNASHPVQLCIIILFRTNEENQMPSLLRGYSRPFRSLAISILTRSQAGFIALRSCYVSRYRIKSSSGHKASGRRRAGPGYLFTVAALRRHLDNVE